MVEQPTQFEFVINRETARGRRPHVSKNLLHAGLRITTMFGMNVRDDSKSCPDFSRLTMLIVEDDRDSR
jgi:hypothetical protein